MKKLISLALAAVLALGILSGCGKKADAAIQIAVPNDTTNEARALLLLEANGIIKLKAGLQLLDLYEDTNGYGNLHAHNIPTYWATLARKA